MHRKKIFRSLRESILPFSLAKLSKSLALSSRRENNINAVVNATRPRPNNVDVSTGSRVQTIPRAVASSFHVTLSLLNLPNACSHALSCALDDSRALSTTLVRSRQLLHALGDFSALSMSLNSLKYSMGIRISRSRLALTLRHSNWLLRALKQFQLSATLFFL